MADQRRESPDLVAVTRVREGREADFEAFVTDVVEPAVRKARPDLEHQFATLRPADEQPPGAPRAYVFLFYGGVPFDDWDLGAILEAAYGADAERHLATWAEIVEDQVAYAVSGELDRL